MITSLLIYSAFSSLLLNYDPRPFFQQTAQHLVACYEKVGFLQDRFDETGECGDESAWTLQTANGTIRTQQVKFWPLPNSAGSYASVGEYHGQVVFTDLETNLPCSFALDFLYSGEDLTAEVSHFSCQIQNPGPR